MSERFTALNASITSGAEFLPLFFFHISRYSIIHTVVIINFLQSVPAD